MKKLCICLLSLLIVSPFFNSARAQGTTGSIAGTVIDADAAVLPGATVTVRGESGQEFTATTTDNGTYRIPAVPNGLYTVTTSAPGFKTAITTNVKVNVGTPATVDTTLDVGDVEQTVEVAAGGEVLQTQTATINSTVQARQIIETPVPSRDALDLVALMPGTASVGAPRRSSINGLPKSSLSITIDGVDVQDNQLRSSDGYFTSVRPRVDAIEEVTVSTANPGAESSGDGAVQIKFVTRRGTNDYRGGLYWQHRNTALNANYWYNNRDGLPRNKIILNQYGGRLGGPLPFPNFGEGGRAVNSGKDRAFFFFNYEEFRLPESLSRQRTILSPEAQAGIFRYQVGGETRAVNLLTLAASRGQLGTVDPTVGSLLAGIRSATAGVGTITPITNSPNVQNFNFAPSDLQVRKFFALRLDFNLTKNNNLELVTNQQRFTPSTDFLNSQDERFPGFPSYTQGSIRRSYAAALRTTFGTSVVNEARFTHSRGRFELSAGISPADFAFQGGYALGIDAVSFGGGAALTTATSRNSYSVGGDPVYEFTDSVSWTRGAHTINFGGQYKLIKSEYLVGSRIAPTISFGLLANDPAFSIFNNAGCSPTPNPATCTLPGATAAQLSDARALYATLVGRVTGYTSIAALTADGTYVENALREKRSKQEVFGLFVQDNWRVSPTLTLNYGLRWQPQGGMKANIDNYYSRLENFDQVYGVSGAGNIFKPGTLTGSVPRVVPLKAGESGYPADWNNFAPSVGAVWSPAFGERGLLRRFFGEGGKSVFRGGYSVAFVREGTDLLDSILGANPGGTLSLTRSNGNGNLTVGTNLRDPNNPNLTPAPFASAASFPITLTAANSTNAFSPDIRSGKVHSFSVGYQRELDRNTVVEFRYVGNRGTGLQRQYNINEFNTIENGFADEFVRAQNNLYANIAAGRGATFAYSGVNTGTSPLPIMLAYFNTRANYDPNNPARYTATNFTNSTLVNALSRNAPNILAFNGTSFENDATRRANAAANNLPANFFYVNPTTGVSGSYLVDNSQDTWYDSGVIEVRRRFSDGLRFQANYVWSKAQSNAFQSSSVIFSDFTLRPGGLELAKNVQPFDIRHNFKFDANYDLPFGSGRKFLSDTGGFGNALLGGWTLSPVIRWQSGSPISLGNVQLVGMTVKELQKEIGVYKDTVITAANGTQQQVVTYLPLDIIVNTQRAFNTDVTNIANNGYGTTYGGGGPTGRFIAPAGYGNCVQRYTGECGFNKLIVYGPSFFKFDVAVAKRFRFDERRNVELRATFLDALNHPNFRFGGWSVDTVTAALGGATFGQLGNISAYRDISTTNDPGGRLIDLMLRINF